MKGFDVMHVKSAVKSHNNFDLSKTHLTTMNIGQIVPLYCEELIPGDKFQVNAQYFSRMAPLVKPTYGKVQFKTVAGFVPYYMVAEDADAWISGKASWEGQTPRHRFITMKTLFSFVSQSTLCDNTVTSGAAHDFIYVDYQGNKKYCRLTQKGKYFVKILNALGYQIPNNVDNQSASTWQTKYATMPLSAYPILAFAKLYNDYMSQSQRYNTSQLSAFLTNVKFGKNVTGYNNGEIKIDGLNIIFNNLFLNYDNDYFTTAWQTPNNAAGTAENAITAETVPGQDPVFEDYVGTTNYDNRLFSLPYSAGEEWSSIGQRALDFLKSFDNWVRRNNYSGSRVVQQIYSRFGIKTDDYRSHYAQVIDTKSIPIQIGDVTSTSDANSASTSGVTTNGLGAYAGKGIVNGDSGFQFKSSDHGLLMILGYYTVVPMNSFGFDRRVLRTSPLDYYTPEFDGIGAEEISVGEYFTNPNSFQDDDVVYDDTVYGFTERYNSYRFPRDVISGEFRNASTAEKGNMDVWHTGRDLTSVRNNEQLVAQSSTVCTLPQEKNEYDRIFGADGNQAGAFDKFYMTAQFHVNAVRPMLSLNQVPGLGEGDTTVARNGNVIS